jgi:hypothetical protein
MDRFFRSSHVIERKIKSIVKEIKQYKEIDEKNCVLDEKLFENRRFSYNS